MFLFMTFFFFVTLLFVYSIGNFHLIMFCLISLTAFSWQFMKEKQKKIFLRAEILFLLSSLVFLFLFLINKINIIWVVFILELQSFIVLGSWGIFYTKSMKAKSIEGSFMILIPSFLSCISILVYVMGKTSFLLEEEVSNSIFNTIILTGVLMKAGAFPYHFWVSNTYGRFPYSGIIFLGVFSKIIVMIFLFYYIVPISFILYLSGIISIIFSGVMMMNQSSLKKWLAFSSISNIGWIIVAWIQFENQSLIYHYEVVGAFFFFYAINFIVLCCLLHKINANRIYNLFLEVKSEKQSAFFVFLLINCLLAMAGVPPFSGFIGKFFIILLIIENNALLAFTLTLISSLFIFNYLRPVVTFYKGFAPYSYILRQKKDLKTKNSLLLSTSCLITVNLFLTFLVLMNF